jgi:hypothetical protein
MYINVECYKIQRMDYSEQNHSSMERETSSVALSCHSQSLCICLFVYQHGQSQPRRKMSGKQDGKQLAVVSVCT